MKLPQGKTIINDMTDLIVPAALRIWLVFLLLFALLGYSVPASILFGAIGGFAGGLVSAWWYVPGGEPVPAKKNGEAMQSRIPKWRLRGERRHLRRRQR